MASPSPSGRRRKRRLAETVADEDGPPLAPVVGQPTSRALSRSRSSPGRRLVKDVQQTHGQGQGPRGPLSRPSPLSFASETDVGTVEAGIVKMAKLGVYIHLPLFLTFSPICRAAKCLG